MVSKSHQEFLIWGRLVCKSFLVSVLFPFFSFFFSFFPLAATWRLLIEEASVFHILTSNYCIVFHYLISYVTQMQDFEAIKNEVIFQHPVNNESHK